MEIGENKDIFLYAKNINLHNTENYHLSIDISSSNFSYCLLDINKLKFVYFKSFKTNNNNNIINKINTEEILKRNFYSASCSYSNLPCTLIPISLHSKNNNVNLFKFITDQGNKIKYEKIDKIDANILYSIDENISKIIKQIQPNIKEFNSSNIFISQFLSIIEGKNNDDSNIMFGIISKENVEIIIINKTKLVFHNIFSINSNTDILYYILYCYEQLDMDPEVNFLYLYGETNTQKKSFQLLYKYIRHVRIGEIEKKLSFCNELNQIPKHQYFALFSQLL